MGDKIRPGRITDEQIEAFDRAASATREAGPAGSGYVNAIRAGLAAAYVRRELENRTRPTLHPTNLDPYPGTVSEVADEIARFVLELDAGPARGVLAALLDWIQTYQQESAWKCTHGADCTVHPDVNALHNLDAERPWTGEFARRLERTSEHPENTPAIEAREIMSADVDVFPGGTYCRACDLGLHVCPGCGKGIPHGTVACSRRCS